MTIKVRIGDRSFVVEIADITTRPIVALVDGEPVEVWPEAPQPGVVAAARPVTPTVRGTGAPAPAAPATAVAHLRVPAPIPGTVLSIAVQPGTVVAAGDDVCVIEAMKMKNTIRAPRPGTIARVTVSVGQRVRHGDGLVEYTA